MKTLILTEPEFEFLKTIIKTAYDHADKMPENPIRKLLMTLDSAIPTHLLDPDTVEKFEKLKRQVNDDEAKFANNIRSLYTKLELASTEN